MPTPPLPNSAVSLLPPVDFSLAGIVLDELELSLPQAARKAARAAEPPVRAMNLRRDTGSAAARAIALRAGGASCSRSLVSGIGRLLSWFAHLSVPYGRP